MDQLNKVELIKLIKKLGLSVDGKQKLSKRQLIKYLRDKESEFDEGYKSVDFIRTLGSAGKDGETFEVGDGNALKLFSATKSYRSIEREYKFLLRSGEEGISPRALELNCKYKYIIMEKLDRTLLDILRDQQLSLLESQEKQIIDIFDKLDDLSIFHADPNPLNFMERDGKIYIIDFGFGKKIDKGLIKKYGTSRINMLFMPTGLILKLKELCPNSKFPYLEKYSHVKFN